MKLLNVANSFSVELENNGTINLNSIMNSVRVSKGKKNIVFRHLAASRVESSQDRTTALFASLFSSAVHSLNQMPR